MLMSMFVTERISYSALYFVYSAMYSNILVNVEFCFWAIYTCLVLREPLNIHSAAKYQVLYLNVVIYHGSRQLQMFLNV